MPRLSASACRSRSSIPGAKHGAGRGHSGAGTQQSAFGRAYLALEQPPVAPISAAVSYHACRPQHVAAVGSSLRSSCARHELLDTKTPWNASVTGLRLTAKSKARILEAARESSCRFSLSHGFGLRDLLGASYGYKALYDLLREILVFGSALGRADSRNRRDPALDTMAGANELSFRCWEAPW